MKKFILALSLVSCITSAHALFGGHSQSDAFNGFYVGAAVGIASNMADIDIATKAGVPAFGEKEFTENRESWDSYELAPWGEIYGGWGCQFCSCLYLGGRFGINFSSFSMKNGTSGSVYADLEDDEVVGRVTDSVRTKTWPVEFTLDLKPGLIICQKTMLFGIVGVAINRQELNATSDFFLETFDPATRSTQSIVLKDRKTRAALRIGLGLECMITRCMSLHASYVYTYYGRLNVQGELPALSGTDIPHTASFRSRASKGVASIGISYYL